MVESCHATTVCVIHPSFTFQKHISDGCHIISPSYELDELWWRYSGRIRHNHKYTLTSLHNKSTTTPVSSADALGLVGYQLRRPRSVDTHRAQWCQINQPNFYLYQPGWKAKCSLLYHIFRHTHTHKCKANKPVWHIPLWARPSYTIMYVQVRMTKRLSLYI